MCALQSDCFSLNLVGLAAEVTRRTRLGGDDFRLRTSSATVPGFKTRISMRGILSLNGWAGWQPASRDCHATGQSHTGDPIEQFTATAPLQQAFDKARVDSI